MCNSLSGMTLAVWVRAVLSIIRGVVNLRVVRRNWLVYRY